MQTIIQKVWAEAWESAFLTSSQVMAMLLASNKTQSERIETVNCSQKFSEQHLEKHSTVSVVERNLNTQKFPIPFPSLPLTKKGLVTLSESWFPHCSNRILVPIFFMGVLWRWKVIPNIKVIECTMVLNVSWVYVQWGWLVAHFFWFWPQRHFHKWNLSFHQFALYL